MENKSENKKRIKDLERAAQAQSSTENRPLKIIWTQFDKWDEEQEKAIHPRGMGNRMGERR
jgi:hypothetical protein